MSLSQQVLPQNESAINGALLEKVIIGNDLSGLSPVERVQYVKSICSTLGLNPITKPIQLVNFQGKQIPYFTKDATEQLRKINKVSISKIEPKMMDGGVYVVTAYAQTPDGRQDSSTGVISVAGLKGDALSNAMMKAETKSKRRVTLSICGLGFIDECEVESIPGARKVDISPPLTEVPPLQINISSVDLELEHADFCYEINNAQNIQDLQDTFNKLKKIDFKSRPDLFKNLIDLKDAKKAEFDVKEFNAEIDQATGEVI